jgi:glutamate synthase domain-containing protein 1
MSRKMPQGLSLVPTFQDGCGVGLVVDLRAGASQQVIEDGMRVLEHLDHRGARGAEEKTGDGAGILIRKPHELFAAEFPQIGAFDSYGVGQAFFAADDAPEEALARLVEETATERHLTITGWRIVPTDARDLGRAARESEPRVRSAFALVHARFSTNTLGAWHLAHPYRRLVHNGECNSIRGNESRMRVRDADLLSPLFGASDEKLVQRLLVNHHSFTGSPPTARILAHWTSFRELFVKVMPVAYERVIRQAVPAGQDLRTPLPPYAVSPHRAFPMRPVLEVGAAAR